MNYDEVLFELPIIIDKLSVVMNSMEEGIKDSEKREELNNEYILILTISNLEDIINSVPDSNEKSMLKSAKEDIEEVKENIMSNGNISDKMERLFGAEITITDVKAKLILQGHL